MINCFFGVKQKTSQFFTADGKRIPVTPIVAGPITAVQVKTEAKEGYSAIKVAFGLRKIKNIKKAVVGQVKDLIKDKVGPAYLREVKVTREEAEQIKVGEVFLIKDVFREGEKINIRARAIGKGFQGVVKRHGFAGGPRTHGQSDRERAPGSIGQTTTPGRVYKGKRMAGRMGGGFVTVKNLEIVKIDPEKNLILVKGLVPGKSGNLVKLYKK